MNNSSNKVLKIKDVIRECAGDLICGDDEVCCSTFSKDTRSIRVGDTYLGIKGENFNGSKFWKEAFNNGAKTCILQDVSITEEEKIKYASKNIVIVENVVKALQSLAKYKRSLYDIPVVAVTGSVGKTSTKDMIASVLRQKYKVLKTEANHNNEIGMPLTILELTDHEAMVLEMGADNFGDIDKLADVAKPTIGVFTTIGTSHLLNFKSRENILKAKMEMLNHIQDKKVIVINNDNDILNNWYEEHNSKSEYEILTCGIENNCQYVAKDIVLENSNTSYKLASNNVEYAINVPVPGKHFVYNSLLAIAVGQKLGISIEKIAKGIKEFELTKMRMDVTKLKNDIYIINDTYNASFDSMKAGIEVLKNHKGKRKIAVLGDMLELGDYSKELHIKTGEYVAKSNINILFTLGKEAKNIYEGAINDNMSREKAFWYDNSEKLTLDLVDKVQQGDVILFKGSRGMRMENILKALIEKIKKEDN